MDIIGFCQHFLQCFKFSDSFRTSQKTFDILHLIVKAAIECVCTANSSFVVVMSNWHWGQHEGKLKRKSESSIAAT